jgi:probable F420-dependent oxidoreductase
MGTRRIRINLRIVEILASPRIYYHLNMTQSLPEISERLRIGVVVNRVTGVETVIEAAQQVEALGFGAAWLTNGGPEDCMPLLAAIAMRTGRLKLGTSVVQTYPRHPVVLASEANVIDQLAPGRLRLGIGPSHDVVMASLGIRREAPFAQLSEYLRVLRLLSAGGPVDFEGTHYRVRSSIRRQLGISIMIGALQPKTFELAGRHAEGAITWLCPSSYLGTFGIPALERGAEEAARARPPLIAHLAVCVHENADEVREAVRNGIPNIGFPSYQRMLVRAGLDEATKGVWTDELVDRVIAWGSPENVRSRILEMFHIGADEVLIRPIGAGRAGDEVIQRTIESVAGAF